MIKIIAFALAGISCTALAASSVSAQLRFDAYDTRDLDSNGDNISGKTPSMGDFYGDGFLQPITGAAQSVQTNPFGDSGKYPINANARASLAAANTPFDWPWGTKTSRVADFNGDGFDDLVAVPYGCVGDANAKIRFYRNTGNGTFALVPSAVPDIRGKSETALAADFDNDGKLDLFVPFYNRSASIDQDARRNNPLPCNSGTAQNPVPPGKNRLLKNVSSASAVTFQDVTDLTGQNGASIVWPTDENDAQGNAVGPPEGAHAADLDNDGLIDMMVGQRLYRNLGNMKFEDYTAQAGLPIPYKGGFEEGLSFIDWNNDGLLDIISNTQSNAGTYTFTNAQQKTVTIGLGSPKLFQQKAQCAPGVKVCFEELTPGGPNPVFRVSTARAILCDSYGMGVADLDNDGYQDVIFSGSASRDACSGYGHYALLFMNRQSGQQPAFVYEPNWLLRQVSSGGVFGPPLTMGGPLQLAFADFDKDGKMDMSVFGIMHGGSTETYPRFVALNRTTTIGNSFSVTVLGAGAKRNQQGRVVCVRLTSPCLVDPATNRFVATAGQMVRVVDGGSGYLSNGQYPVAFGTGTAPTSARYFVSVRMPVANNSAKIVTVSGTASPGQSITLTQPPS